MSAVSSQHGPPPAEKIGTDQVPIIPKLLTKQLVVQLYVPVNLRTLERWISAGEFPQPDLRHGEKLVFWRRETVDAWFDVYVREHSTK